MRYGLLITTEIGTEIGDIEWHWTA